MKRLLYLIPFLVVSVQATPRNINNLGERGKTAINLNFEEMDKRINNAVLKTSTQTVSGKKYFEDIQASTMVVTNLSTLFKIKVGSFTSKATTGTQNVTGVGFKPRFVQIIVGNQNVNEYKIGIGAADAALNQFSTGGAITLVAIGGQAINTSNIVYQVSSAGAAEAVASLVSMDMDGFTLNWSAASAQTMGYVAIQ